MIEYVRVYNDTEPVSSKVICHIADTCPLVIKLKVDGYCVLTKHTPSNDLLYRLMGWYLLDNQIYYIVTISINDTACIVIVPKDSIIIEKETVTVKKIDLGNIAKVGGVVLHYTKITQTLSQGSTHNFHLQVTGKRCVKDPVEMDNFFSNGPSFLVASMERLTFGQIIADNEVTYTVIPFNEKDFVKVCDQLYAFEQENY